LGVPTMERPDCIPKVPAHISATAALLLSSLASVCSYEAPANPTLFVLRLAGLSPCQAQDLVAIPCVQEVRADGQVVFHAGCSKVGEWESGARELAAQLLPGGSARLEGSRGDAVCSDTLPNVTVRARLCGGGKTAEFVLRGYAGAWPGLIEHEMLRDLVGLPLRVERLSGRIVVVGEGRGGLCVAWTVNEQFFACAYGVTDLRQVAPYLNRFGSAVTSAYRPNLPQWLEREIQWRLAQLERLAPANGKALWLEVPYLTDLFPELFERFGVVGPETTRAETLAWLRQVRQFLEAQRGRFRYSEERWGFVTGAP
jgi:hypothetical protein